MKIEIDNDEWFAIKSMLIVAGIGFYVIVFLFALHFVGLI